ncbi:hypothetical protein NHQ30_006779 [Ciborinia camelliae]|nr:hypothetical protein NHQ30_006779 [Ciborinia camelliae]
MEIQTPIRRKPAQSSFQHTQELQYISPNNATNAEAVSIDQVDSNSCNESEAQYCPGTVKPQPGKSSLSIHPRSPRDSDESYELENSSGLYWWRPIIWMVTWILLGLSVALGHHFAYQRLDRKPPSVFSQTWAHSLGSVAAFLVKTSFTITVLLALQEVLWFSFRKKAIKISLLDKLFTLSSNPFSFVPSAFVNAPLATLLAAFAWTIPISAILSPGSLVVGQLVTFNHSICHVPTFAADSPNISFYQMTTELTNSTIQGPNPGIQKLASQIFAQGTILPPVSPCGANCSYKQAFYGPALQCSDVSNNTNFSHSIDGSVYYNAKDLTKFGEDEYSLMEIIITYFNSTDSSFPDEYTSIICLPYNTTYDISVNYTNGLPKIYTNLTYNTPLLNLNGTELMYPQNFPWISNSATLVREVYDNHLNGTWIQDPNRIYSFHDTMIENTILAGDTIDANNGQNSSLWFLNRDLLTGIPELLTNLTISTLAFSPITTTTPCSSRTEMLVYYYNPNLLLIPYSIALILSLISFAAGVYVLKKTGIRTGEIFSQILVTTRNPFLDEIAKGHSLSSADADEMKNYKLRLGKLKRLHEEDSGVGIETEGERAGYAAFGLAEQVDRLH